MASQHGLFFLGVGFISSPNAVLKGQCLHLFPLSCLVYFIFLVYPFFAFFSLVRGQENGLDGAKAGGVAGRGTERGRRGRGRGRGKYYC